jgi:hypothetical protein
MKPVDLQTRLEMLERMVLELGTELYNMRGTVAKQRDSHEQFLGIMKGLKQLLDEKGLITVDDFDAAIDIGEALERFNAQRDVGMIAEMEATKKSGH